MAYMNISDVDDITLAIEKLIEEYVEREMRELQDEHDMEVSDIQDELQEARQVINDLQRQVEKLEDEIQDMLNKEGA